MTNDELLDALVEGSQQQKPSRARRQAQEFEPFDPADYEPVHFSFSSVKVHPIFIPADVEVIEEGRVRWTETYREGKRVVSDRKSQKKRKDQKRSPGLLTSFTALEKADDKQVCDFIKQWGVLGIDTDVEGEPGAAAGSAGFCRERTETYRQWARRVRAVQTTARALQQGNCARLEDWAVWLEHPTEEKAVSRYRKAIHDFYLLLVRSNVPDAFRERIDPHQDPAVKAAQENIEECKAKDYSLWEWLKQHHLHPDLPADERVNRSCVQLARIMDGWLVSRTWYLFNEVGALGQARPMTQMQLADNMVAHFWNADLAKHTVLLPLGQALLHSLQSPAVACKVCGKPVSEPSPDVRKGFGQFCSMRCDNIDQRARNRANYQKKAGRRESGSSSSPFTAPPAIPAPGVAE